MQTNFKPRGLPVLIGSLPLTDHRRALDLIFEYTPEIPLWPQLPANRGEKMIPQFLSGMPGAREPLDLARLDTSSEDFENRLVEFFQVYLEASEDISRLEQSPLALDPGAAKGFYVFLERLAGGGQTVEALKGQITGPFTFCTGVSDQHKRAIVYDDTLRDAGIKLIALKAGWQAARLAEFGSPVIIFIDEPALAGFGSSEFISISRRQVQQMLQEVVEAIHSQGALAGIHVCANTDWSLILDSAVDIVNFDAFGYFDRFILYGDAIKAFVSGGGILALGKVPTGHADDIESASAEDLYRRLQSDLEQLAGLGLEPKQLVSQCLVTPSCGTGSLSYDQALKVLALTRELSQRLRSEFS